MQGGKTLGNIVTEIEGRFERDHQGEGIVVLAARENPGDEYLGFVLVFRADHGDYATLQWNSSRNPTALYDGHYDMDYEEALMDFEARR